jgi:hypothetical protein
MALDAPASCLSLRRLMSDNQTNHEAMTMFPRHINAQQWQQSTEYARQVCARLFRDGLSAKDALAAFGLREAEPATDWSVAVDRIAQALCSLGQRKVA